MKPVIIFDSGLGGLSVSDAVAQALPHCDQIYAVDNEWFPYGGHDPGELTTRIVELIGRLVAVHDPSAVVIACNTASTLVMDRLRAVHDIPFVGTVPAIKPAAETTESGLISVLATPGTVRRDYTKELIDRFASQIDVTLVGAPKLAGLAEIHLGGGIIDEGEVRAEIADAFVTKDGRRTDIVALGCTHYPLIQDMLEKVAPWPVNWIDPAPAVARRLASVIETENANARTGDKTVVLTAPKLLAPGLADYFAGKGFGGFAKFGDNSGMNFGGNV